MAWTIGQRIAVIALAVAVLGLGILVAIQALLSAGNVAHSSEKNTWQVTVSKLDLSPGTCLNAPSTDTSAVGSGSGSAKLPAFNPDSETQTSVNCSAAHQAEVLRIVSLPGTPAWSGDLNGDKSYGTPGGKTFDDGTSYMKSVCQTAGDILENQVRSNDAVSFTVVPVNTGLDDLDILGVCVAVFGSSTTENLALSAKLDQYASGDTTRAKQLVGWDRLNRGACLSAQSRSGSGSVTSASAPFDAKADEFVLANCDGLHSAEVLRVVRKPARSTVQPIGIRAVGIAAETSFASGVCDAVGTVLKKAKTTGVPQFTVKTLTGRHNDASILAVCVAAFAKPVSTDLSLSGLLDSLAD